MLRSLFVIIALLVTAACSHAAADGVVRPKYQEWIPPEMRDVGIDEKPAGALPLDARFLDETGKAVSLQDYFTGDKPVIVQLGYFGCPQLCGQVTEGMVASMQDLTLALGADYRLLYISFDPTETYRLAGDKKQALFRAYGRPEGAGGLHLLTGDKGEILRVADAVGFRFKWVQSQRQFSHPAAIMVYTPDGRLSRYLYGIRFDPRTLRLSLVEASEGKIGTTVDRIMLICYMYDGITGRYGLAAMRLMQTGGAVTVLAVGGILGTLFYREHRRRRLDPAA